MCDGYVPLSQQFSWLNHIALQAQRELTLFITYGLVDISLLSQWQEVEEGCQSILLGLYFLFPTLSSGSHHPPAFYQHHPPKEGRAEEKQRDQL